MRPRLGLLLLLAVSVEMIAAFRSAGLAGRRLAVLRRGAAAAAAASTAAGLDDVVASIKSTGDRIRELKAAKADKAVLQPELDQLLSLKAKYQVLAGAPYDPPKPGAGKKKEETAAAAAPASSSAAAAAGAESLVITPRGTDYSAWYSDVISAADMVDQSPVRGCMVIKPWGMGVWDLLRAELDERIRDSGTQNAYFPLFIPMSFLAKEAEHVDGFVKECAVVTHHRLCAGGKDGGLIPDPEAELEEPLIVRPTSETIIWNMFGKWINSYRDLPLKINQWANVVRWEMRTRPFLRSAEFLWQEGHTAHATAADAQVTARESLDMYASVCEELLAMPTVKGAKSPAERFAGADDTYTIEALMQNGWALQSGTSHFLGQNFARAFDVFFQTETGSRELVWATSWGVSTRLLGAMVMTHSDDRGLVLPPRVAPVQVVVVPITKGSGDEHEAVLRYAEGIAATLKAAKVRAKVDARPNMRPGAKYFEWERKGVPLRLEVGPRDLAKGAAMLAVRVAAAGAGAAAGVEESKGEGGGKVSVPAADGAALTAAIKQALEQYHASLLASAYARLAAHTHRVESYAAMKSMMAAAADDKQLAQAGFYLVPWKCDRANEEAIKEDSKATIRCYPFEHNQQPPAAGVKCFYSGDQATHMALFARAF